MVVSLVDGTVTVLDGGEHVWPREMYIDVDDQKHELRWQIRDHRLAVAEVEQHQRVHYGADLARELCVLVGPPALALQSLQLLEP